MKTGIYSIKNVISGKMYIGSAFDLDRRIGCHKSKLKNGKHANKRLQSAWNVHGAESFVFNTILECEKENVLLYEQLVIDAFDSYSHGYNLRPLADSNRGWKMTPEAKEKLRAAHTGKKQTAGHIQARTDAALGKKRSQETKDRMSAAQTGKKMSPEARAKMSARVYSSADRLKMSAIKTGTTMSVETRAKMSASGKERWARARVASV